MEVAFHSNKCALKDSLRLIRIAKNPCWKRRAVLLSYSKQLISNNKNIASLYTGISESAQDEFSKLEKQFASLESIASPSVSKEETCPVCLDNCLVELDGKSHSDSFSCDKAVVYYEEETGTTKTEKIERVAEAMKRLATKTEYIESVISMHKEELDKIEYINASAQEYSENHLLELERTIRRKKRALFIKKWISGLIVFFCFVSLLFLRPFIS